MISCDSAKELIGRALDGTIETAERATLEEHARACPACREGLERFELMQEVIGDAFASQTEAAQAQARIIAELSAPAGPAIQGAEPIFPGRIRLRTAIAAAITLVAGLALGFAVGRGQHGDAAEPFLAQEVPMRVGHLEGMVLVRHDGDDSWQPLQAGASIYRGDTFHSTAKGQFVLELENNSTIQVNPNSMLALVSYGDETEFSLEQGECTASLQSPHGPFFVRTPHGRMEALGTEFTVTVE